MEPQDVDEPVSLRHIYSIVFSQWSCCGCFALLMLFLCSFCLISGCTQMR